MQLIIQQALRPISICRHAVDALYRCQRQPDPYERTSLLLSSARSIRYRHDLERLQKNFKSSKEAAMLTQIDQILKTIKLFEDQNFVDKGKSEILANL